MIGQLKSSGAATAVAAGASASHAVAAVVRPRRSDSDIRAIVDLL
jgi:hypothetical protein